MTGVCVDHGGRALPPLARPHVPLVRHCQQGERPRAHARADDSSEARPVARRGRPRSAQACTRRGPQPGQEAASRSGQSSELPCCLVAHVRPSQVPRRSILKVTPAVSEHANTTNFTSLAFSNPPQSASTFSAAPFELRSAGPAESESDEDSDNGEQDMDITQMEEARSREGAEERRKSMARRVSFAPNAHIRCVSPSWP